MEVITTDRDRLKRLQAYDLEAKIMTSKLRIQEFYDRFDGQVYEAFSGGKDSTVMRHITRSMGLDIPQLFSNTGLEYPEIVSFVKSQSKAHGDVVITRPKTTFRESILTDGFPLASKKVAEMVQRMRTMVPSDKNANTRRLYMTGERMDGTVNKSSMIPHKWKRLIDAPFNTTAECCNTLKKEPFKRYEKESGRKPMSAIMNAEGGRRGGMYECNTFDKGKEMGRPMLFWTEDDVWEYIKKFNVPYASCYDDYVLEDGTIVQGEVRTGCMFCGFGAHLEKGQNRFQRMKLTHPKQWNYCINKLGMGAALDFIGVPYN